MTRRRGGDAGAAPVDFVLLAGLLTAMFLGLLQLGVALHVRNVLASAAAEGARYGANEDVADHAGAAEQRTRDIITKELAARFAGHVTAGINDADDEGAATVVVDVNAAMPLVALWGEARTIHVRGRALREGG